MPKGQPHHYDKRGRPVTEDDSPFNSETEDDFSATPSTRREVIDLGFKCALTTETGFNTIESDLFTLKRFSTGNSHRYVDVTASGTMRMLLAMNRAVRGKRRVA